MCELCGCEAVKARTRSAKAEPVTPMLAAVPVKIVTAGAESVRSARQRQVRAEDRRLRDPQRPA